GMKVSERTFAAFWSAHAWTGMLVSVVLFVTFFLGAFALYWEDFGRWQEPRLRRAVPASEAQVLDRVQEAVAQQAARGAVRLDMDLPDEHVPWIPLATRDRSDLRQFTWIDPATGAHIPTRSDLGYFLYLMHVIGPIRGGIYLAGV
ncbi:PepSY domain-containing protein, partial [Aeromonas sp. EERV15]|uniref:PepSY domain-containing protein n=1 Tax=Aeromonas sp. EERV15 TaxID=1833892 RepID=UPI00159EF5AB